jgi:hypothetical protein
MGIGSILKGAAGIITGGLGDLPGKIMDTVAGQFPDKMSEAEKKAMEVEIMKVTNKTQIDMMSAWNEQEKQFQDFTKEMEGSAQDLKSIPVIGHIIIFLRAAFRPVLSFAIGYADMMIFSGSWNLTESAGANAEQAWSLLWVTNAIILSFYFGERAMKNLGPLIEKIIEKSVLSKDSK